MSSMHPIVFMAIQTFNTGKYNIVEFEEYVKDYIECVKEEQKSALIKNVAEQGGQNVQI